MFYYTSLNPYLFEDLRNEDDTSPSIYTPHYGQYLPIYQCIN